MERNHQPTLEYRARVNACNFTKLQKKLMSRAVLQTVHTHTRGVCIVTYLILLQLPVDQQ